MGDRHYALFANNLHPLQLDAYNSYNSWLKDLHDSSEAEKNEADAARFEEIRAEKESTLMIEEGESLGTDDLADVHMQVKSERRTADNFSLNTKSKDGSIADYLELRRPFGTSQ